MGLIINCQKQLKNSGWQYLIIGAAIAILLSISGAFGTFYFPFLKRLLFWLITIAIGYAVSISADIFLNSVKFLNTRPILYHIIFITFITFAIAFFTSLTTAFFQKNHFDLSNYYNLLFPVFIICLFITVIHSLLYQTPLQSHKLETNKKPEIFNRFEVKFRNAEIHAIKSEDHYLRFYTSNGEFLLLMRLYDAIKELDGIEGTQCHRSWWVAKSAVETTENEYGKKYFVLKNNIKAPISRSFVKRLKDMNWF